MENVRESSEVFKNFLKCLLLTLATGFYYILILLDTLSYILSGDNKKKTDFLCFKNDAYRLLLSKQLKQRKL